MAVKAFCNKTWQGLASSWQEAYARAEALERGVRLENPVAEGDFWANLAWMIERGQEHDLNLLQRLKQNPLHTSTESLHLLDLAIQRIQERTDL